jgi:Arc-like DNA binding domain
MTDTGKDPTTTVRLPRELLEQMRECARLHDRSLVGECRVALAAHVRRTLPKDKHPQGDE